MGSKSNIYGKIAAILVCVALLNPALSAADAATFRVKYAGGSLSEFKAKDYLQLSLSQPELHLSKGKKVSVAIPVAGITEVNYGQEVRHRILEAAAAGVFTLGIGAIIGFSKSKKHYVGLIWDQPETTNKGGIALQVGKNEYRGLLLALESMTGKKAVDTDAATLKQSKTASQPAETK